MAIHTGDHTNNQLYATAGEDNRLNGFGTFSWLMPQWDELFGNDGSDTFVLGGHWGVSYMDNMGWGMDGYARIKSWDPSKDKIEVVQFGQGGFSSYSIDKNANVSGGAALDTRIFFTNADGQRELIAVIEDNTNFNKNDHFVAADIGSYNGQDSNNMGTPGTNGAPTFIQFSVVENSRYDSRTGLFTGAIKDFSSTPGRNSKVDYSYVGEEKFVIFDNHLSPQDPVIPFADLEAVEQENGQGIEYRILSPTDPTTPLVTYSVSFNYLASQDIVINKNLALTNIDYIISNELLSYTYVSQGPGFSPVSMAQVGTIGNDVITAGTRPSYLEGFGAQASEIPQFDTLKGGSNKDIFSLGGEWGVSYFEKGDGYATIVNWQPNYDRIEVLSEETLGGGEYFLRKRSVQGIGTNAQDTEIFYKTTRGKVDRIAIVQDSRDVNIERDFIRRKSSRFDLLGGVWDDVIVGDSSGESINGFGTGTSGISQFDSLTGGGGNDRFILGGKWGVSYFERGDGYAVIEDWDPGDGQLFSGDRIVVLDPKSMGGGYYSLKMKSVGGIGTSATDTEIYFTTAAGQRDRIAIIKDSTNVNLGTHFNYINPF